MAFAGWRAHTALVEIAKDARQRCRLSRSQISVTYWWDNQIPNQGISFCYRFLDATWVCAGGDVQLRGD